MILCYDPVDHGPASDTLTIVYNVLCLDVRRISHEVQLVRLAHGVQHAGCSRVAQHREVVNSRGAIKHEAVCVRMLGLSRHHERRVRINPTQLSQIRVHALLISRVY